MIKLEKISFEETQNFSKKFLRHVNSEKINLKNIYLKTKEISEDDEKKGEKNIQNITDTNIKLIEEKVISKEKEIMTI